jgi:hypothetical protein
MHFTDQEKNFILQDFPKFELSYENMIHNKVHNADILLAIPEGKKCYAWFTSYKEDNVCFLLELIDNKIKNISVLLTTFDDKLAYGTVFYGTMFKYNNINCFCIEDLYYCKGKNCTNRLYSEKLDLLRDILLHQKNNRHIIFGLPLMMRDFASMLKQIELLPYKICQIKFRFFEKNNARKILFVKYFRPRINTNNNTNNNKTLKGVFKITADIEPDIYNLFSFIDGKEVCNDVAFIPDYKTSVLMNKLFRNIKENDNLDALEESDDEDEFEDSRVDKFVYLDRSFKMNCEYNYKFKKWVPISLADQNERLSNINIRKI